jgi:DNA-binding transcriptional MerR regulator
MKTMQVANKLGVSDNTIRNYCENFGDFLSESATPDRYAERQFTDLDVEILSVIVTWKKQGLTYGQIREKLERGDQFREGNLLSRGDDTQQAIIVIEQYQRQIDALTNLVLEQSRTFERHIDRLQQQLNEAHQEIGRLKAQVEAGSKPSPTEMGELTELIRELRDLIHKSR